MKKFLIILILIFFPTKILAAEKILHAVFSPIFLNSKTRISVPVAEILWRAENSEIEISRIILRIKNNFDKNAIKKIWVKMGEKKVQRGILRKNFFEFNFPEKIKINFKKQKMQILANISSLEKRENFPIFAAEIFSNAEKINFLSREKYEKNLRDAGRILENFAREQIENKGIPAISVAAVVGQKKILQKKIAAKNFLSQKNIFRVASISKIFTAIAAMQLAEKNLLQLDEPIENFLPEIKIKNKFNEKKITVRQLLSHRAGLFREPKVGNFYDSREKNLQKTVASLHESELKFPPEKKFFYSNAGAALVGRIVEKISGQKFENYVAEKILQPLEMRDSFFKISVENRAKIETGFLWSEKNRAGFFAPIFNFGMLPAANFSTSARDMSNFLKMIFANGKFKNKKILSKKSLAEMKKIQFRYGEKKNCENRAGYGLGFFVHEKIGEKNLKHRGEIPGFSARFWALDEPEIGIFVASNLDKTNSVVDRIAKFGLQLFSAAEKNLPLPIFGKKIPLDAEKNSDLIGFYKNKKNLLRIFLNENKIFLDDRNSVALLQKNSAGEIVVDDRFWFGDKILPRKKNDEIFAIEIFGEIFEKIPQPPKKKMPEKFKKFIGKYGNSPTKIEIFWDEFLGKLMLREDFWADPLRPTENSREFFCKNRKIILGEKKILVENLEFAKN